MKNKAEVVIIGGGVVGCAISYELAKRGMKDIVLLERKYLTSGATGRCGAGVRQQWGTEMNLKLSIGSVKRFETLREDLDIAVIIHRGKLDDSDYIASHLTTIPCTVVGSPALIQRCGLPSHTTQLQDLPCITTVSALKGMPWLFTLPNAEFSTVQVNEHYRVNSGELALKAALAGVGFAILAKVSCQEFIDDGSLVEIELELPAAPLQLFAVYANRQYLPAKTRVFIEFVRQNIMSYQ